MDDGGIVWLFILILCLTPSFLVTLLLYPFIKKKSFKFTFPVFLISILLLLAFVWRFGEGAAEAVSNGVSDISSFVR